MLVFEFAIFLSLFHSTFSPIGCIFPSSKHSTYGDLSIVEVGIERIPGATAKIRRLLNTTY